MPGCRDILTKLKTLSPKKVGISFVVDTAVDTVVGCGAGALGAGALGLDREVGAQMGAAGNAVFGAARSLVNSVYKHVTAPEIKEQPEQKEQKRSLRKIASSYLFSYKQNETTALQPAQEEQKEINYMVTLFNLLKYPCEIFTGCLIGYGILNMPKEFSITDVAESSAVGVGIEAGMCIFVGVAALIAPYLADKCVEAEDLCCGDADDYRTRRGGP